MPRARGVAHSLGAPAEQPDTGASAGAVDQVASSVFGSKAKGFSWKLAAPGS